MTTEEYQEIRQSLGSQTHVAELLGVDSMTVSRRERGVQAITHEAALALRGLKLKAMLVAGDFMHDEWKRQEQKTHELVHADWSEEA